MPFRLQNSKVHLTYKGHLDLELLLAHLNKLCPRGLKYYSLVHENGATELNQFVTQELGNVEENSTNAALVTDLAPETSTIPIAVATDTSTAPSALAYAHTHVLFESCYKITTKKCNFFDFQSIHPNIKVVLSVTHFLNCWKYHSKAPIKLLQSITKPLFDNDDFSQIRACKSLAEACKLMGVTAKTVNDLVLIRRDEPEVRYLPLPIDNKTDWIYEFPTAPVLFMTGASGIGKTRWVYDQFEHPLFVTNFEDLKKLKVGETDCIIFDDMIMKGKYSLEECIQLCDISFPRTINVKYGSVTIPAGMRRIFTSNKEFDEYFPEDTYGALRRRVTVFRAVGKLYADPPEIHADPLDTLLNPDAPPATAPAGPPNI